MNPFLEVPIRTADHKGSPIPTTARLRPGEISYYYDEGEKGCTIVMKSGTFLDTSWTFDQVDTALTSYERTVNDKNNKGKFGNVVVRQPKADAVVLKPELKPV